MEQAQTVDPPSCVGKWFGGCDPLDTVALYPLTPKPFLVTEMTSKNTIRTLQTIIAELKAILLIRMLRDGYIMQSRISHRETGREEISLKWFGGSIPIQAFC